MEILLLSLAGHTEQCISPLSPSSSPSPGEKVRRSPRPPRPARHDYAEGSIVVATGRKEEGQPGRGWSRRTRV